MARSRLAAYIYMAILSGRHTTARRYRRRLHYRERGWLIVFGLRRLFVGQPLVSLISPLAQDSYRAGHEGQPTLGINSLHYAAGV